MHMPSGYIVFSRFITVSITVTLLQWHHVSVVWPQIIGNAIVFKTV